MKPRPTTGSSSIAQEWQEQLPAETAPILNDEGGDIHEETLPYYDTHQW
jgi:hypothetical protein